MPPPWQRSSPDFPFNREYPISSVKPPNYFDPDQRPNWITEEMLDKKLEEVWPHKYRDDPNVENPFDLPAGETEDIESDTEDDTELDDFDRWFDTCGYREALENELNEDFDGDLDCLPDEGLDPQER